MISTKELMKDRLSRVRVTRADVGPISVDWILKGRFTICEMVRNGKHYQGLSTRNPHDKKNRDFAKELSFKRAFKDVLSDVIEEIKMEGMAYTLSNPKYNTNITFEDIKDVVEEIGSHPLMVVAHDVRIDPENYRDPSMVSFPGMISHIIERKR